jgi:L-aminopeptidase/D-esterase-like protein
VAVNACGSATVGGGPHFWAAPFESHGEFGGLGFPAQIAANDLIPLCKGSAGANTTIALVATDADCTKAQLKQIAGMAQDGIARAIYPAHTALDGDTVFSVSTGRRAMVEPTWELTQIGLSCANVLARAIARAVFEAAALPGGIPSWHDCHT